MNQNSRPTIPAFIQELYDLDSETWTAFTDLSGKIIGHNKKWQSSAASSLGLKNCQIGSPYLDAWTQSGDDAAKEIHKLLHEVMDGKITSFIKERDAVHPGGKRSITIHCFAHTTPSQSLLIVEHYDNAQIILSLRELREDE